jgi:hypothetical protein
MADVGRSDNAGSLGCQSLVHWRCARTCYASEVSVECLCCTSFDPMDVEVYDQRRAAEKATMLRRPWPPLYRQPFQHRPRFCIRAPDPPADWREYSHTNKGRDYYFMAPRYRNVMPPPPPPRHMLVVEPRHRRATHSHVQCPCLQASRSRSLDDVPSEVNSEWEEDGANDGPWSVTRPLLQLGCNNKENHRLQRRSMENLLEPSTPWRKQSNQVPLCSLWSGKVLLALASTVILDAESRGTHDRILLSHDSGSHVD